MNYLYLSVFMVLLACNAPEKNPTKSLFNGEDLSGWHLYNAGDVPSIWFVEDGLLTCDPEHEGEYGDLVTDFSFEGSYTLNCEWKVDSGGNSGIFLQVVEAESLAAPWMSGVEYQILDHSDTTNHNYGDLTRMSGAFYGFQALPDSVPYNQGDWNRTRIVVNDNLITFFLNEVQTAEMDLSTQEWRNAVANSKFAEYPEFGKSRRGKIALQAWKGRVQFRNIKLMQRH